MSLKRTPLYEAHHRLGARLIDFGGWEVPVQYSGIVDEHLCVRKAAGLFDISHMGEVEVSGPDAPGFLDHLLTNRVRRLGIGQGQYTLMCNEAGGVVDDLYLYRLAEEQFLMIINASRTEADMNWINRRQALWPHKARVSVVDRSNEFAAVAVQGPRVVDFIGRVVVGKSEGGLSVANVLSLKKNEIARFAFQGESAWIGRTGYTGEDGFEIVAPEKSIGFIWNKLLAEGHAACLQPCGLGARDTLRTEMGYPLYGHELTEAISPLEAGLGFFVGLDKADFVGKAALSAQKERGLSRRAVAFVMSEKSPPPRPNYPIRLPGEGGEAIGEVTSGTQSPSLGRGIGLGLIAAQHTSPGTAIAIEIRGRLYVAEIARKPLYHSPPN